MRYSIDDVRILETLDLTPASALLAELPVEDDLTAHIHNARESAGRIIHGGDDRLIVVVGPCSIHDREAAMEYGRRLAGEAERHRDRLLIVMRVYFEKPRTTVGWKGLINHQRPESGRHLRHQRRAAVGARNSAGPEPARPAVRG